MATKREINKFLKENNFTKEDVQKLWDENKEINPVIRAMNNSGIIWERMNISAIRSLIGLKERTLERMKEDELKKEQERIAMEKKEKDREYYLEHFEEIMVQKIDSKENLTERELSTIVFDYGIDTEYGENRRWARGASTIVKLCGRYFCVCWDEGLTEYQDNEFYEQPYEVEKRTYEKTITVTEWVEKEK